MNVYKTFNIILVLYYKDDMCEKNINVNENKNIGINGKNMKINED